MGPRAPLIVSLIGALAIAAEARAELPVEAAERDGLVSGASGGAPRMAEYVVREGDSLGAVAKRFDLPLADLLRFNGNPDPDRLRPGQILHVPLKPPPSWSRSVGMPNQGRLVHGRRLSTHPSYVIRDRGRAWATDEVVEALLRAFDAVRTRHPRAPRIEVHDLSLERGGPMSDHKSHESGRDVDLALYRHGCPRGVCDFRRVRPGELDSERQWTLLRHLLTRHEVESIFVDYRLQAPLWKHARAEGATPAELRRWFQYPNGPGHPVGVIRHFRKHDDHLHVRFACHTSDPECRGARPARVEHASR
jgi:murein endopeptidase